MKPKHLPSHFVAIVVFILATFSSQFTYSQAPEGVNYQAVARDNDGDALVNRIISVRFGIIQNSINGTLLYEEQFDMVTTNDFGLFNLEIGDGGNTGNGTLTAFSDIDWGSTVHFLKVEVDAGSGFEDLGTTQLLSVPYALYAKTAGNQLNAGDGVLIRNDSIFNTGDTSVTNEAISRFELVNDSILVLNEGSRVDTVDLSVFSNQLTNQDLDLNENGNVKVISITGGNQIQFSIADADSSTTNEIQNLSINANGDSLLLSNGDGVEIADFGATDNQQLSFNAARDSILLEDGSGVSIEDIRDSLATYNSRLNSHQVDITANQTDISNNAQGIIDSTASLNNRLLSRINSDTLLRYINDTTIAGQLRDTSATLRSLIGSTNNDDQQLSFNAARDSILLEDGSGVSIEDIRDSLATYNSRLNNHQIDITANQTDISNNAQGIIDSTTSLNNRLLSRINSDTLLRYINDTTIAGQLRDTSATLRSLIGSAANDDQQLSFNAARDSILLEDGSGVSIEDIRDSLASYDNRITLNQTAIAADNDGDASNELQTISKTGAIVTLSNGGGSYTDSVLTEAVVDAHVANNGYLTSEIDGSVTNELQTLSFDADSLRISSANAIRIYDIRDSSLSDIADTASAIRTTINNLSYNDDDDWVNSGVTDLLTNRNVGIGSNITFSGGPQSAFAQGSFVTIDGLYGSAIGDNISLLSSADRSSAKGFRISINGVRSHAFGSWIEIPANDAFVIGGGYDNSNRLVNSLDSSIMLGYGSVNPTLIISRAVSSTGVGKVGIGVSTPDSLLDVAGGISAEYLRLRGGAQNGYVLTSDANGSASWQALSVTAPTLSDVLLSGNNASSQSIQNLDSIYTEHALFTRFGSTRMNLSNGDTNIYIGYFGSGNPMAGIILDLDGTSSTTTEVVGLKSRVSTGNNLYGGYFESNGGESSNIAIYANAINPATPSTNNYAALFDNGKVQINDTLIIPTGAVDGYILTSDAMGKASWQNASSVGDNLGSHIATQNLDLDNYTLVGNGGTEGLTIAASGEVSFSQRTLFQSGASVSRTLSTSGDALVVNFNSSSTSGANTAVRGTVNGTGSANYFGGYFQVNGSSGGQTAVYGFNTATSVSGQKIAVRGLSTGINGANIGIYGSADSGNQNYAGYFEDGYVYIKDSLGIGVLSPSAKLDIVGKTTTDTLNINGKYTFPSEDGDVGNVLQTDGLGNVSWVEKEESTCPTGMVAAGPNMCIETGERGATTWFVATTTCAANGYKLPTWAEWYSGVSLGTGLTDTTDDWEWVDGGTSNTARKVGQGGLQNVANEDPTESSSVTYRCVYYLK